MAGVTQLLWLNTNQQHAEFPVRGLMRTSAETKNSSSAAPWTHTAHLQCCLASPRPFPWWCNPFITAYRTVIIAIVYGNYRSFLVTMPLWTPYLQKEEAKQILHIDPRPRDLPLKGTSCWPNVSKGMATDVRASSCFNIWSYMLK